MNSQSTRASAGYHCHGIEHHAMLTVPRRYSHHKPRYDGGLSLGAAVLLMVAGAVGTVWVVELVKMVWIF